MALFRCGAAGDITVTHERDQKGAGTSGTVTTSPITVNGKGKIIIIGSVGGESNTTSVSLVTTGTINVTPTPSAVSVQSGYAGMEVYEFDGATNATVSATMPTLNIRRQVDIYVMQTA